MSQDVFKLYSINSTPNCAYFLSEGCIYFYASNMDKYAISGRNLIVGATELIMNSILSQETDRIETAVSACDSVVKKISAEKFITGMESYSFLINTSIVLAKQVLLTNKIINKAMNQLGGNEKILRDLSITFYNTVALIEEEYTKRKLPWLDKLLKNYTTSLSYKRGEAFHRSMDSITVEPSSQLSDKITEYHRGSIICEENTNGEELYVLQAGSIDVEIGGNRVATIEKSGTVFGEMALLLNEKRTATLKAKNNTVITKILKHELKEVCEKQSDLLKNITYSLAQRHYYNIIKISTLNDSLIEKDLNLENGEDKKISQVEKTRNNLSALKRELEETAYKKDADFLTEIINTIP